MGVPQNLRIDASPRASIHPIELFTPVITPVGTPRNFLFEDSLSVMTPKTPVLQEATQFTFYQKSALIDAVERGDEKEVSDLIDLEVDVNETYVCNVTPLIVATKNGHEEIVEKLLGAGAEVDQKDSLGRSSLMWACISYPQNEFVVWRLLNAGASREGVSFGYGMNAKISTLLKEFDDGLLLPRDVEKVFKDMAKSRSKIHPDLLNITLSFLTLTLPSLKNTMY